MPEPLSLTPTAFDFATLLAELGDVATCIDIEHVVRCSSTNTLLRERMGLGATSGSVLVADEQTAGRGRRGRSWVSTPGYSLTFSLLWKFPIDTNLDGLSLVAGLAVARALEELGLMGVGLKWPNDIWLHGRKLGGVLVEVLFEAGHTATIIGIGLNLRRAPTWQDTVDQPFATLEDDHIDVARESVLATLLKQLLALLNTYAKSGFAPFLRDWERRNALHRLPVVASSENGQHLGICLGVAKDGALQIQDLSGAIILVTSGDVSLRLATQEGLNS